ncbi:LexA-binding, inner membrane-associated putative hydrolase [Halogranum gelatinilyticum]|uniref:LexA-binding, inner membrane-associated putative hydrolase n=1 Tax=Halogranum gelatinilyticum TaxID=660521 RepID=A0A1G9X870_9EURY|nr:metal-dependent hydrolase [Halogranum gelatinilyticum]SDM92711.1 LexA-binding, inner membrane-associated putative hydrolase [Halogranum gelatinilyticum]
MWPWGHAAVGYLLYSLYSRSVRNQPPTGLTVVVVGFGTQFPDLIDKPLAWTVSVLPAGRSLAHSLLTASLVIGVVVVLARRANRSPLAGAFGIGYLSHLAADGLYPFLEGEFASLSYLAWPLLPLPAYETDKSILAHFAAFEFELFAMLEFGLVPLAFVVWVYDDYPGIDLLRRLLTR